MYEIIVGRNEKDKQRFGLRGAVLLGKQYVQMGQTTSLSNPVYVDVAKAHVIFVVGKRGSGKCLSGDTKITLRDGKEISISELANSSEEVVSLNSDLKIQATAKTDFFSRQTTALLALKLRSGKSIRLTPEHPLFTVKGWTEAQNLTVGSRIATPRILPFFGNEHISEEKTKLLAYLIAEGHLGNEFVLFSNSDEKIVADFRMAVKTFDPCLTIKNHSHPYCYRITTTHHNLLIKKGTCNEKGQFVIPDMVGGSNSLKEWLKQLDLYGKKAKDKFIPACMFTAPKQRIALFLNRLFSCDGSIYQKKEYWQISYCSVSRALIDQVHSLLLRFGIVSRIQERSMKYKNERREAFEIIINGECVTTFIQEIGFYGAKDLKSQHALTEGLTITRNPNTDTTPKEIWQLCAPKNWAAVGRGLNYAFPKAARESQRYAPSRQKLLSIAFTDESELAEKFASSDIFWDEIVSIEKKEGAFIVYDISVPEHHNFVANNIIVHNSYTMGAIAEGIMDLESAIAQNLSMIMLDTMGVYWTMKYANKKENDLLKEWGLKAKGLDVQIFTPIGLYKKYKEEGIPCDHPFAIQANELDADDWCLAFGVERTSEIGVLIERVINQLNDTGENFSLQDIIDNIIIDKDAERNARDAAKNRFMNAERWGLFDVKGTKLNELVIGGKITVLDVSAYATMPNGWAIKSLVIGLTSKKLFIERMKARRDEEFQDIKEKMEYFKEESILKKQEPLVWLVVDEAHEFLPATGSSLASQPLITILREGRQPGISLILASQQPGKIHTDVMTQSDIIVSLRLTAKLDTDALKQLAQSYLREGIDTGINQLPRTPGAALILDDANERVFSMQVRPRITWHGGEAPTAIVEEKKQFL